MIFSGMYMRSTHTAHPRHTRNAYDLPAWHAHISYTLPGRDMAHTRHIIAQHMLNTRQCHIHETLHFTVMYDIYNPHAQPTQHTFGTIRSHAFHMHAQHMQHGVSHVRQLSDTCTAHVHKSITPTRAHST